MQEAALAARVAAEITASVPPEKMLDFDEEARRLRAALGLDGSRSSRTFRDMDKMWTDKRTGGSIFVGNEVAAKGPLSEFERHGIEYVVNCACAFRGVIRRVPPD